MDRSAIFDLYCENENGEKFIIERQNAKQLFFKDRGIIYPPRENTKQNPTGPEGSLNLLMTGFGLAPAAAFHR